MSLPRLLTISESSFTTKLKDSKTQTAIQTVRPAAPFAASLNQSRDRKGAVMLADMQVKTLGSVDFTAPLR
ncbi:MAG: hypothetical protein ACREUU_09205, partial [Gammaproteobacteria bacterium]